MGFEDMTKILVPLNEFRQGLKSLKVALSGKRPPDVVFYCSDGFLFVKAGGSYFKIPASGQWELQARVKGKAISLLSNSFQEDDPLPLTQFDDKLGIGNLRLGCHWEKSSTQIISLPINASLIHLLRLWQRYSEDEIEKSGLKTQFLDADQERVRRINSALQQLAPLGVTEEDLTTLVDEAIKRINLENFKN